MKYLLLALGFATVSFEAGAQTSDSLAQTQINLIRTADSLIASYKFESALNLLSKGDSLDKDLLLRIGHCHLRLGTARAAIRPYERVLKMDSTNLSALNQLGQLYARDGDYAKALPLFLRLIAIDSANGYYCKQIGSLAARSEDKATAIYWYRKALHFNPADAESSLSLGNILFEFEEYESVDTIVNLALAQDSLFKPMIVLRAKSAFEQQRYESVIATINSLLQKSDTTALYARLLGISYFHQKDYHKLMTCMTFLLKNRYDQEWIYYYMGLAARELGDVPTSINWFKLAVQKSISENTKVYYSQLGQSHDALGEYPEAIRAYKAAYDYSREGILLYHLARNYDMYYKDKTMALAFYRRYLKSDDTIRLAREYARRRMQDMGDF